MNIYIWHILIINTVFYVCFYICFQTGQLKEYDQHKEMASDVVCMALGNAPSGEQMSRFLAVGLADNTVRIISLDPDVSCNNILICSWRSIDLF